MHSTPAKPSQSVYRIVTDRILQQLEQGVVPWHRPWAGAANVPRSLATGRPYRGVNVFLLATTGYTSPDWLTFKQAQRIGARVRKGEHGFPVVFWKWLEVNDEETGEPKQIPLLRYFTVFNSDQCDGETLQRLVDAVPQTRLEPIAECERILAGMPANRPGLHHGASAAFYRPAEDAVYMPDRHAFEAPAHYYGTLFHELTHATGHESRLARPGILDLAPFGSPTYSREELIAEMGAAYLCGHAGIDTPPLVQNSAAYLQSWIATLRGDSRLVVQAAGAAQRASDWILGQS